MYIIPVDIDQLCTVIALNIKHKKNYIHIQITHVKHSNNYIPRELFNMIQILFINFSIFLNSYNTYEIQSAAINHNSCDWNNLRNLRIPYNITPSLVSFYNRSYLHAKINKIPFSK